MLQSRRQIQPRRKRGGTSPQVSHVRKGPDVALGIPARPRSVVTTVLHNNTSRVRVRGKRELMFEVHQSYG